MRAKPRVRGVQALRVRQHLHVVVHPAEVAQQGMSVHRRRRIVRIAGDHVMAEFAQQCTGLVDRAPLRLAHPGHQQRRHPGLLGIKPQRDRVPLAPHDSAWRGLSVNGPMARTVEGRRAVPRCDFHAAGTRGRIRRRGDAAAARSGTDRVEHPWPSGIPSGCCRSCSVPTWAGGPPLSRAVRALPLLLSRKDPEDLVRATAAVPLGDANPGNR